MPENPLMRMLKRILAGNATKNGRIALQWMQEKLELVKKDELYDPNDIVRINLTLNHTAMVFPDVFTGCTSLIERMETYVAWLSDRLRFIENAEKKSEEEFSEGCKEGRPRIHFFKIDNRSRWPW